MPDSVALAYLGDISQKKAERHSKLANMHLIRGCKDRGAYDNHKEQSRQQYALAREWYTKAVGIDPCNSWALGQLAYIHLINRDYAAAEDLHKQVCTRSILLFSGDVQLCASHTQQACDWCGGHPTEWGGGDG